MELKGSTFLLRGWCLTDAESLQRSADNKNVSDFLMDRFPCPFTMADAETWVKRWEHQYPVINFAIVDSNNVVIGGIGLEFRADIYCKTPLLGYWLAQPFWGKGIMSSAVALISHYAFNKLGAICITAYALSNNPASMRVLEKAGFIRQGVINKSVIKNNQVLDEHIFALQAPE